MYILVVTMNWNQFCYQNTSNKYEISYERNELSHWIVRSWSAVLVKNIGNYDNKDQKAERNMKVLEQYSEF